jgi:hypothetical protein
MKKEEWNVSEEPGLIDCRIISSSTRSIIADGVAVGYPTSST